MKKNLIITIIILLIAGAVYYFYKTPNNIPKDPGNQMGDQTFCTQEALLCPDGSGVGRHGDECKFTNCPDTGPYIGKLEQTNDGFRLIMESPDKNSVEVTYVMPLEIKISNALAQFINQRVKVFGIFIEGNTLKVDRIEETSVPDITLGEVVVGKTVFVNGARITLNKIVSDSRCPIDVQCIQAGSVVVNVTLKSSTDLETRNIELGKSPVPFDSFHISIESIKPDKISTYEIDPQSYILTFRVAS